MNTNYLIESIQDLLKEDCIVARFYPLIPYRETLISNLRGMGCKAKSDCMALSDEAMMTAGLPDAELVQLFRMFLTLYDIKPAKLREIPSLCKGEEESRSFYELYHLPGVKSTRAGLYCKAGYRRLSDIALSSPGEMIAATEAVIRKENLSLKAPLPKEVKTHIAVARAFCGIVPE